jgi:hypothetical protein
MNSDGWLWLFVIIIMLRQFRLDQDYNADNSSMRVLIITSYIDDINHTAWFI